MKQKINDEQNKIPSPFSAFLLIVIVQSLKAQTAIPRISDVAANPTICMV